MLSRGQSTSKLVAEIKSKTTIPQYFYQIILPQMGNYYSDYPIEFESRVVNCCPLHDEDTPSCRYYEDTNSFYCFGCQRGGDIIALHRYFTERMNGTKPSYREAVEFLYNYFIAGKETEEFLNVNIGKASEEKLNSDNDIVKFNIYRVNLEKAITFDRNLSLDTKIIFWDLLDNIDLLLSKNEIRTTDAEEYLRNKVKELIQ